MIATADSKFPVSVWIPIADLSAALVTPFVGGWMIVRWGAWVYPLVLVAITNRMMVLLHLTHEALHRNLFSRRFLNDFVGSFLCGAPILVSLRQYKRLHLHHHQHLNEKGKDPDYHLSENFPMAFRAYLLREMKYLLSGKLTVHYLRYYSEILGPGSLRSSLAIIAFWLPLFVLLAAGNFWGLWLLCWLLPWILFQLHLRFMAAFQHAPLGPGASLRVDSVEESPGPGGVSSRNIEDNPWLLALVFPRSIHLHGVHHWNPRIPYYRLKDARELAVAESHIHTQSFRRAWRNIFGKET